MIIWYQLTTGLDLRAAVLRNLYQKLISRNTERGQIQAVLAQAVPVLVSEYNRSIR
jgi:hypothetical protein